MDFSICDNMVGFPKYSDILLLNIQWNIDYLKINYLNSQVIVLLEYINLYIFHFKYKTLSLASPLSTIC